MPPSAPAPTGFVTPEGGVLDLEIAGLGSRFVAALIDGLWLLLALLLLGLGFWALASLSPSGLDGLALPLFVGATFFVPVVYYTVYEGLRDGASPGKRSQGLRVVRTDGRPAPLMAALIRNLLRIVDGLFGYAVGVASIVITRRSQRLGDLAARTLVVHDRTESAAPEALRVHGPPWSTSLDVSRVGPREYAMVRSFLRRRDDLRASARAEVAADIAATLRGLVVGVPPSARDEAVITAVAEAVRNRSR